MPPLEAILGGVILLALTCYVLTGGADYGGGVFYLLALGPRKAAQRRLVAEAIGPIWEANHVWLILIVVVLFTAFPPAFSMLAVALHIPLTLMLFGIVLRGSAFAFNSHDAGRDDVQHPFGAVFAVASLVTPVLLGMSLGAIASGRIDLHGDFYTVFVRPWLAPFPFLVGLLALSLFAYLAAVYLSVEAGDPDLREDFRVRALASSAVASIVGLLTLLLLPGGAPLLWSRMGRTVLWPVYGAAVLLLLGAALSLWQRRFRLARACAVGQVMLILWGWALGQYPWLVVPHLSLYTSAAPAATLRLLTLTLAAGAVLLFPSFFYLYRVFKRPPPSASIPAA